MPEPLDLAAMTPSDAALAIILQSCGRDIDEHMAGFLDGTDPDCARKARVALRRLTTTLDAFAPILRKSRGRKLHRRAKQMFRLLGHVRDADVVLGAGVARKDDDTLRDQVRAALRRMEAVTFGARLQSPRMMKRLLRDGKSARKLRRAPLSQAASAPLNAARRHCLTFGADLGKLSDRKTHALRKALKAWRYLAEFFAPCWPSDARAGERRADFQALQDALGILTDQALIRRSGAEPLSDMGAQALIRAQGLWSALAAEKPWWQTPVLSTPAPVPGT